LIGIERKDAGLKRDSHSTRRIASLEGEKMDTTNTIVLVLGVLIVVGLIGSALSHLIIKH
jgi:hypothetical protein